MMHGRAEKPVLGRKELVYQDPYQTIHKQSADFGNFRKEYFVRDGGPGAGIVVVDGDSVLLVRQYRLLIDGLSWEIPGGKVEEGEQPKDAAVRECLEETGIRCRDLEHLVFYYPSLDILHSPTHLFSCSDWSLADSPKAATNEIYDQSWVPIPTCIDMLASGQIVDGKSITGLLSYLRHNDGF